MHRLLPALLLLTACDDTAFGVGESGADPDAWSCDSEDHKASFVIQQLAFSEAEDGVVWGFDLDDDVTDLGDSRGCGKQDLVDPEGNAGIDNAFSQLYPAIENTEAAAVGDLMQNAVNAGELLMVFEVLGLDDPVDDDCVTMRVGTAEGTPILGTDGYILDGQTFTQQADLEPQLTDATEVVDGVLTARGVVAQLDLQILDAELAFAIDDGMALMALDPELSSAAGHFGGGFSVAYVIDTLQNTGVDNDLADLLAQALPLAADLDGPEGECAYMSVDLQYTAVQAFYSDH